MCPVSCSPVGGVTVGNGYLPKSIDAGMHKAKETKKAVIRIFEMKILKMFDIYTDTPE